jgi:hypothetical protein
MLELSMNKDASYYRRNGAKKHLKNKKAIVSAKGDTVEIKPFAAIDLTEYFYKKGVDLKTDL